VVRAVGAKISSGKLKRDIPVYEEHSVDQDLLAEGQRNLRDELQSQGYFEAAVEFEQRSKGDNEQEIEYRIEPGTRHTVVELDITGNRYFNTPTLRERMLIQTKSLPARRGRFSDALRRRDEESIADVYRQNGFRDVAVTATVEDNYRGKRETWACTSRSTRALVAGFQAGVTGFCNSTLRACYRAQLSGRAAVQRV
jgi:outer membrane protein assembly factor BamA